MLASGYNNSTTTYAYDPSGARVLQTSTTSTTYYPNKYYSFTSTKSEQYVRDFHQLHLEWRYVAGDHRPETLQRCSDRLPHHAIHSSRSSRLDECGHRSKRQPGAASGLLPLRCHGVSTSSYPTNEKRQYIGRFSDAQAGLNYLNARYYNSQQGQFLSQDPVFWGNQNIIDPQALNAYSYAEDNPIVKKDPSGRCPQCLLGAGAAIAAQYGYDVFNNYQRNGLTASDLYSGLSSPQTYLVRAGQGAIIGATGGLASAEVFGSGVLIPSGVMGIASGVVGAGGNALTGDAITPQSVFWDTTIGTLSFGLSELTPGVRGALPKFGTNAFYFGAHTQASALSLSVDAGFGYLGSISHSVNNSASSISFTSSYNSAMGGTAKSSNGGGGGGSSGGSSMPSSNSLWVTPSGAVVTWGGSLVVGPVANSTPQSK